MRVYLAARFSRRDELLGYATELQQMGIEVVGRWLFADHVWRGVEDGEIPTEELARFATEDLDDIQAVDVVVCFTEPARTGPSRGGRHFETGYAFGLGKDVMVVGDRENIFYCLDDMHWAPDWPTAKLDLRRWSTHRLVEDVA